VLFAEEERRAAVELQRLFRGGRARRRIQRLRDAAVTIQRVQRGHVGRRIAHERRSDVEDARRRALFDYCASQLQKLFRGYYSRRYRHDFFARKRYIRTVLHNSETLRQTLRSHEAALIEDARRREEEARAAEFKRVSQGLHHLLSTSTQPGVYNSPFAADAPPVAFGKHVEEHLRDNTRELIATRGVKSFGVRQPVPRVRRSLQASVQYGAEIEAQRAEKRYERMLRVSQDEFVAGTKPHPPPARHGVGVGTAYLCDRLPHPPKESAHTIRSDPWQIHQSTRQINDRDHTKRVSARPFVSATVKGQLFDKYDV
jgi:hypothetical protein